MQSSPMVVFFSNSDLLTLKYQIEVHVRTINFWLLFRPVRTYSILYVYYFLENILPCTVIPSCSSIRDLRVLAKGRWHYSGGSVEIPSNLGGVLAVPSCKPRKGYLKLFQFTRLSVHPFVRKLSQISTVTSQMSLIKVAWYVTWVKNMHFESPSDPSQTAAAKAKLRYVYLIMKLHIHFVRRQVRLLLSEAKPSYVHSILQPYRQSSRGPVRALLSKAKPSCVYSIVKPHGQSLRR